MPSNFFEIHSIHKPQIIRSKRRTLALQITPQGELIVRAPLKISEKYIENFICKQADWIAKHRAEKKKNAPKKIEEGEKFWLWGKEYQLTFGVKPAFVFTGEKFEIHPVYRKNPEKVFAEFYKKELRKILPKRIENYEKIMCLKARNIKITSAERRWGSCNVRGNLSFGWRLAMLPPEIADYVIVHELAHLAELNHSPAFWKVVEKILPDYKIRRKWLRKNETKFSLTF